MGLQIINVPSGGQVEGTLTNIGTENGYTIGYYHGMKFYYSPSWREWFAGDPPTHRQELNYEW